MRITLFSLALVAGAALAVVHGIADAQAPDAPSPSRASMGAETVDAGSWGPYPRLAGTTRQATEDGYRLAWHWTQPGKELVEEWISPSTGAVEYTRTITPGETPGTLHMQGSELGGRLAWDGTITADGWVQYVGTGMLKLRFMVGLTDDDVFEMRRFKLRRGEVVADDAGERTRFTRIGLPTDATAVGATAASPSATAAEPMKVQAQERTTEAVAPSPFAPLERYIGRRFVGGGDMMELRLDGDDLVIQFLTAEGDRKGRYLLRPNRKGGIDMVHAANDERPNRTWVDLKPDGRLSLGHLDGAVMGFRYRFTMIPEGDSLETQWETEWVTPVGITMRNEKDPWVTYEPLTEARVIANFETRRENEERERIRAERRRAEQAQRDAALGAAMAGIQSGASQGMADYQRSQAQQQAFLDDVARDAHAIDAQRQAEIQRQRDAEQARRVMQQPGAAPTPPAANAGTSNAGAGVASTSASAGTAAAPAAAKPAAPTATSPDVLPPGKPLHFVLSIAVETRETDTRNMGCFAEMTIPGPDGWRIETGPGVINNSRTVAEQRIKSHYPAFIERCRQVRPIAVNGTASYQMDENDRPDVVQREMERARGQGMVIVSM